MCLTQEFMTPLCITICILLSRMTCLTQEFITLLYVTICASLSRWPAWQSSLWPCCISPHAHDSKSNVKRTHSLSFRPQLSCFPRRTNETLKVNKQSILFHLDIHLVIPNEILEFLHSNVKLHSLTLWMFPLPYCFSSRSYRSIFSLKKKSREHNLRHGS